MNINELKTSKFLKKEDVGPGRLVTITGLEQVNVALEEDPEELKWVIHFKELAKGMVLNSTNAQLIAIALKSEDTDHWTGRQIVLYNDPSIAFRGRVTGGIRCRAPKPGTVAPAPSPARPEPEPEQDPETPF